MASTPDLTRRTQISLDAASAMLDDMLEHAGDWGSRPEEWRADFVLDWEAITQRLEDLRSERHADELSLGQHTQLDELRRRFLDARDIITRLGLTLPELDTLSHAS